jgi:hypothetical protein
VCLSRVQRYTASTESIGGGKGCGDGGNSPCSASASSNYADSYPAALAVDGLLDTAVHTSCYKAGEWFEMDLGSEHKIVSVKIIARTDCYDCANRIEGAEIRVGNIQSWSDNQACATILSGDAGIFVGCAATGRYVFVVQPRSDTCLNFAEIEVLSLNSGSCVACAAGKHSAATARARACVRARVSHTCNKHASSLSEERQHAFTTLLSARWWTGTYKEAAGNASCSHCPSNTFSPAGSASCSSCPNNTFSPARSATCSCNAVRAPGERGELLSIPPSLPPARPPARPPALPPLCVSDAEEQWDVCQLMRTLCVFFVCRGTRAR